MRFFDTNDILARLGWLVGDSQYAVPIWTAVFFIACAIFRRPAFALIFKGAGIKDDALRQKVKTKIDVPLRVFFLLMAVMPFTAFVRQPYGAFVVLVTHLLAFVLLFHIIIQVTDLGVFSWWATRRGAQFSSVVRFCALTILYLIAGLLVLDWGLGLSILPLITTSTVITAVLGLALQDTLKNVFAGLNMSLEQGFKEGDWVSLRLSLNETCSGRVVEIGWRTTKILTANGNYAIIPNSELTTHTLTNLSKPGNKYASTITVPAGLKADPEGVCKALSQSAAGTKGVLSEPKPEVTALTIEPTYVLFQIRYWTDDMERQEALSGAVLASCLSKLQEAGALP